MRNVRKLAVANWVRPSAMRRNAHNKTDAFLARPISGRSVNQCIRLCVQRSNLVIGRSPNAVLYPEGVPQRNSCVAGGEGSR
jgi:hypothetical protein